MVRLFVPEGDGQHVITPRRPPPLPAETRFSSIPASGVLLGAGWTGLLALAGRSRPGTFLRCTAVFSAIDLAYRLPAAYGTHHLNKAVFKMENIDPQPFKLWERTPHWTMTDATLVGGALGLVAAISPRALPGISGWRRYLGAATVGCYLGLKTGQTVLLTIPPHLVRGLDVAQSKYVHTHYHKLNDDNELQASLSLPARWRLKVYMWAEFLSPRPLTRGDQSASVGGVTSQPTLHASEESDATFILQLDKGALAGPDLAKGVRLYEDDMKTRDPEAIKEHLAQMVLLKEKTEWEIEYLWQDITNREERFYQMDSNDQEKPRFQKELHLLNDVFTYLRQSAAIFSYHIADAHKQLQQINSPCPLQQDQLSASSDKRPRGPELITAYIRKEWTMAKDLVVQYESVISHHSPLQPRGQNSEVKTVISHWKDALVQMKEIVETSGRVLKDYEEKVRVAEAQSVADGKTNN